MLFVVLKAETHSRVKQHKREGLQQRRPGHRQQGVNLMLSHTHTEVNRCVCVCVRVYLLPLFSAG